MAVSPDPEEYDIQEMPLDEFEDMLGSTKMSDNVTEYVTFSDSEAYEIIRDATRHNDGVVVKMRDGASDMLITIPLGEGGSNTTGAKWLMREVIGGRSSI